MHIENIYEISTKRENICPWRDEVSSKQANFREKAVSFSLKLETMPSPYSTAKHA